MAGKPELLMIGAATPRMIERLAAAFVIHKGWERPGLDEVLTRHGAGIAGITAYGSGGRVDAALIDRLPNLKIIANFGVGYDAVDAAHAASRRIIVTHTPTVLNREVANTAIMLMLAVSRCLVRDVDWVRSGQWKAKGAAPLTRSIEGKRVGILGLGRIGETLGRKLAAFDCEVVYHSRRRRDDVEWRYFSDLVEMARAVDYLVVITPGGPETHHLVNRAVIDALGPEGTLINIARGSVVDEKELVVALVEGRLGYAGLDVFEREPEVPAELLAMDNVVLTPHVGSATQETRRAMGDLVVDNLLRYFADGTVLTPVPESRPFAKLAAS